MQLLQLRPWTVAHLDGVHTLYLTELSTVASCTYVITSWCSTHIIHINMMKRLRVSTMEYTTEYILQLFLLSGLFWVILSDTSASDLRQPFAWLCLTWLSHQLYVMFMLPAHACACALAAILCHSPPQPYQGQGRVLWAWFEEVTLVKQTGFWGSNMLQHSTDCLVCPKTCLQKDWAKIRFEMHHCLVSSVPKHLKKNVLRKGMLPMQSDSCFTEQTFLREEE